MRLRYLDDDPGSAARATRADGFTTFRAKPVELEDMLRDLAALQSSPLP